MTTEYQLSELTPLNEALLVLVRAGIDTNHFTLRSQLEKGVLKGRKVGRHWHMLNTEIERLKEQLSDE